MTILHLEDDTDDATLVAELLTDRWPDCAIKLIATRAAYINELRAATFDLILSDFSLVAFNGLEALQIARRQAADTPFIFLSGTIGEDRAIEAMQAGASDYVLKDRMKRLVSAIERALAERQERQQRRLAEEAHHRLVAILESTPDLVSMARPDGHLLYLNRAGRRMIGIGDEQDVSQMSLRDLHPPAVGQQIVDEFIPATLRDSPWTGETTLLARDGRCLPVSQVIIAHPTPEGGIDYLSTIMRDLSAHKAAERRLREFADFLNKARDAIIVTNLAGEITYWNEGAERIFGWSSAETLGHTAVEIFGASTEPQFVGTAPHYTTEDEWRGELRLKNKLGRLVIIESGVTSIRDEAGQPRGRLSISTDITAKKSLEEQFLRAQRLESIGLLAAGIAHDLNNVLAPILLGAPMLRESLADAGDKEMMMALERSAERGAGLVRQILGFARGAGGEHRLIQVKHLTRDITGVIRETFPKNIRLDELIPQDLWPIKANPTQVHQVLLNLCVNARDAMADGGTLHLRAQNTIVDDRAARAIDGGRPGPHIVLEVEDTGCGIAPEIIERIWEPFFTTKEAGKGTGLGLPTVRGIVENHNGFLTIRSVPGRGTIFRIYLPAAEGVETGDGAAQPAPALRGNGELILVVDDEQHVREMTATILARHGYRVLQAKDGAEALALFAPRSREIHLIVTDVNMPVLDGPALASVAHRINEDVKVLAISGMSNHSALSQPDSFVGRFLLKPFKAAALLAAVHELLHAAPVEAA